MKGFVVSALVAVLLCIVPAVAHAESSDEAEITAMAKEHYKLGLDAYKNGRYPEAIKELKKAYLLKRLPALLLNIGATYRKMGDADNAVYYYKKYLAEAPDAKRPRRGRGDARRSRQGEAGRRRRRHRRGLDRGARRRRPRRPPSRPRRRASGSTRRRTRRRRISRSTCACRCR